MKNLLAAEKIAIVYDHLLTNHGGAEFVLATLLSAFPNAPIFTAIYNHEKATWAKNSVVIPSFLQNFSFFFQQREILDLCTPIALEQLDLSQFSIIISVTSSAAKGILTSPNQLHICYLLTPTRYLYQDREKLSTEHNILSLPIFRRCTKYALQYLLWWDQVAAFRPDKIIAISQIVARRTEQYYHRKVDTVLYPPVEISLDTQKIATFSQPFFLSFSRLVSYKRIDLIIKACFQTGKMLLIGGTGSDEEKLTDICPEKSYRRAPQESIQSAYENAKEQKRNIVFLGSCSTAEKQTLFNECAALVMPGIEDFGITAVEANSFGKPVILSKESGAAEVVLHQIHGLHLEKQSVSELIALLNQIEKLTFAKDALQKNALRFSRENFIRKFHNIVYQFSNEHSTIRP